MRIIYTWILCLCFPLFISAQNFAPLGTTWTYHRFTTAWYSPKVVQVYKEDSINGQHVTYASSAIFDSMALLDKGDKIYFYSIYNRQFNLLYDFNAKVGDTIIVNGLNTDSVKGRSIITILDIENDTACDDGLTRKRWKTKNIYEDKNGNYVDFEDLGDIIEGIGSTRGLFPNYGLSNHNGIVDIRCYNNGVMHCQWIDYPCDTFFIKDVATNNLTKEEVNININCISRNCTLNYTLDKPGTYFFLMYNLQGQEIRRLQLVGSEESISLSVIFSGIHLWNVVDGEGRHISGKILIE